MEISKMSSYLGDKIHLEKVTGQNVIKNLPLRKAEPSSFENALCFGC
jgi:hypothetical protein